MRLIIDTGNGLSGDIFSAGLLGLGVDEGRMVNCMEYVGNKIGTTKIIPFCDNNVYSLYIKIDTKYGFFDQEKAGKILLHALLDKGITESYQNIAIKTLEILCDAEKNVHFVNRNITKHHTKSDKVRRSLLHESIDILIDIIGMVVGLEYLGIDEVKYLDHVNVGNGEIILPHCKLDVPPPATRYILDKYQINWKKSNVNHEMVTPTGATILAGCNAQRIDSLEHVCRESKAKGTKNLPPVNFYLSDN